MVKIFLGIIGILALIGVFMPARSDPVNANVPWLILVLCLGFIGIIQTIEKLGKNK